MPAIRTGSTPTPPPVLNQTLSPGSLTYRVGDAQGNTIINLHNGNPSLIQQVDIGFPDIREVVDDRAYGSGTSDATSLFGARPITLSGTVLGTLPVRTAFLDLLRGALNPLLRPYFYLNRGWATERRFLVRSSTVVAPYANTQQYTVTVRAPDGVMESAALSQAIISSSTIAGVFTISGATIITGSTAISAAPTAGISFPTAFPWEFDAPAAGQSTPGLVQVTNNGNTDAWPTFIITGPCTAPKILCATTGAQMSWPSLTLGASDTLVVDCKNTSSLLDGNPNAEVFFDPAVSTYATVPPDVSQWQNTVTTSGPGFQVLMGYRDTWL